MTYCVSESRLISVERILRCSEQLQCDFDESVVRKSMTIIDPQDNWPMRGSVRFDRVCMQYR